MSSLGTRKLHPTGQKPGALHRTARGTPQGVGQHLQWPPGRSRRRLSNQTGGSAAASRLPPAAEYPRHAAAAHRHGISSSRSRRRCDSSRRNIQLAAAAAPRPVPIRQRNERLASRREITDTLRVFTPQVVPSAASRRSRCRLVATRTPRFVPATHVGLERISASRPRRRRDSSPRSVHVAAAASPRRISAEYPRGSRGVATTTRGVFAECPRGERTHASLPCAKSCHGSG